VACEEGAMTTRRLIWRRWPGSGETPGDAGGARTSLLDADDGLAAEFDPTVRDVARHLITARALVVTPGAGDLASLLEAARPGPGLLVLDGLLALETHTADRVAAELVGSGDLIAAPELMVEDLVATCCCWRTLWPTRLALLDGEFVTRVRPFPQVSRMLLRRACNRSADLDLLRSISSQPRLEVRLVLLLWHLASRWGRVEPEAIRLSLPLTHRLLGQLIAAERPSVSHALKRLARAGLITGAADDLHLHGSVREHLAALGCPVERQAAAAGLAGAGARISHGW
jgi:CRP/FNR family cyclic AMP-dependent transcriptional regulator